MGKRCRSGYQQPGPAANGQMDAIGDIVLGNIRYMKVNENGNLYLAEPNQNQIYVLDPDGKLIVSFGGRGEGPGEFKFLEDFFITGAYVIVPGMVKIHYFSQKGDFIKDVNLGKMMIPRLFIDENRLVKFSLLGFQGSDEPNYIEIYHLEGNQKFACPQKFEIYRD